MRQRTYTILNILASALFVCGIIIGSISSAAISGEGLTISPPLSDINADPGQSIEKVIRVTNPTDKLIEVYPRILNFKAKGEGGEPAFYDATDDSAKFALSKWITFSQSKLALAPEQIVEFKYVINVPTNAEPGGHYGAVFFSNEPPTSTSESKVSLGSMIGSLVLAKVSGQTVEKGFLEAFSADKSVYIKNNVNIATRISNIGNIHFKPKGNIVIKSVSGKEVERLTFNEQGGNVLPDSTRKFENKLITKKPLFGRFTAEANINYGEDRQLTAKTIFWIIPPWFVGSITFLILTLVLVGFKFAGFFGPKRPRPTKVEKNNTENKIILR